VKDKMKGLIVGLTIGSLLSGTAALAAGTQIEVAFRTLKYMFDGVEKVPAEGKGFIYEGNTYVPLRFVSESLGKPVEWDETNNTIWIGNNPTHIVASYQGGQVTKKEFDTYQSLIVFFNSSYSTYENKADFRIFTLNQLIKDSILSSRASEEELTVAKQQAVRQISTWKAQDADKWSSALQAAKLTEGDMELFLTRNNAVTAALNSSITDDELKAKFQANLAADKDIYTVATVRHILVGLKDQQGQTLRTKEEALKKAQDIELQLKNGGDFDKLAKENSDDPGSKDQGGLYKDADVSGWDQNFKKAAVDLPIGEISDPVETIYGYHVMKVESRAVKTLDQVKTELQYQLAKIKLQTFLDKELPGLITKVDLDTH
jgi:foldase protein PrsA